MRRRCGMARQICCWAWRSAWLLHAAALGLAVSSGELRAGTIHVTPAGTDAAGADWSTPTSLTNALAICTSTDQVWVAEGAYTNGATFTVGTDCAVYGGFTNGMATFAERDWTTYPAILDGNAQNRRVVTVTGGNVVLDGLVISNSYGSAAGGLTKTVAGDLRLANCRIVEHTAGHGGGVYAASGTLLMTNCVVAGNRAHNAGGYDPVRGYGVYAYGAAAEIVDCVFSNQTFGNAWGNRDGYGAALYMRNGNVRRTEFIGNRAANQVRGGAVAVLNGDATISNCVFRGNSIDPASAGTGGALHRSGAGTLDVVNCTFSGNYDARLGGAVYLESGALNLRNCILWTNSVLAGGMGYEIYVAAGAMTVSHCDLPGSGLPYVYGLPAIVDCLSADPLYASATDLHLQSPAGRWDPGSQSFATSDLAYSPCIDTDDRADAIGEEPTDNGNGVINMGAYGGIAEASKSRPPAAPLLADGGSVVNGDHARIDGQLTNDAAVVARVYLCYGPSDGGTATGGWAAVTGLGNRFTGEVFSAWTAPLSPSTTYHYRLFATNVAGSAWTADNTLLTGAAAPGGGTNVIHVDRNATGAGDGTSWPHAYTTIYEGFAAIAGSRTNVWITGGTYAELVQVILSAAARVVGGFAGTESAESQRTLADYTVIDGENGHRCLAVTAAGAAWLDTLICSNSPSSRALEKSSGAGHLVVNNCRLVNNVGNGGYFTAGSVMMTNCVVADNRATAYAAKGIGIYMAGIALDMVDCLVSNNYPVDAWGSRDGWGGGVDAESGTLRVRRTEFIDNRAADQARAGAVYVGGTATFSNCLFRGNSGGNNTAGGAFYVKSGANPVELVNCTLATNSSTLSGGGIFVESGSLELRNCILWTNRVTGAGTGHQIHNAGGTVTVRFSLLTGTNAPQVSGSVGFAGCLTGDPLFASATDLHLESKAGRWDPATQSWIKDLAMSPCIDAGDPADAVGLEPVPNGRRINMGVYGGTEQASKSVLSGLVIVVR